MKIRCKPSVNPAGTHPRVRFMTLVVAQAIHHVAGKECVVTSLCDGIHGANSFHYILGGADYRSHHLTTEEKHEVLRRVRDELGDEFDFILEDEGLRNEHYHGEWDNNPPGEESSRMILQRRLERMQEEFVEDILDPDEP